MNLKTKFILRGALRYSLTVSAVMVGISATLANNFNPFLMAVTFLASFVIMFPFGAWIGQRSWESLHSELKKADVYSL